MKLQLEVLGTKDLERKLPKVVDTVIRPQSGISDSLKKGAQIIVHEARMNVWDLFNTKGDFPSKIQTKIINQYRADIEVRAIYAAVHEYGGTFIITEPQRSFFWAKWYQTGEIMWKALALKATYTIPPRPYLRPAIDAKRQDAIKMAAKDLSVKIAKALRR